MSSAYTDHYLQLINLFVSKCNYFVLCYWKNEMEALQYAEQKICSNGILYKTHEKYDRSFPVYLSSELSQTIINGLLMKPFGDY